jgi:hypothetical protein
VKRPPNSNCLPVLSPPPHLPTRPASGRTPRAASFSTNAPLPGLPQSPTTIDRVPARKAPAAPPATSGDAIVFSGGTHAPEPIRTRYHLLPATPPNPRPVPLLT